MIARALRPVLFSILIVASFGVTGFAVVFLSVRAVVAIGLLIVVFALATRSRSLAIVAVVTIWLIAPMIRRILALYEGNVSHDILSVVPFLAILLLAFIEIPHVRISSRGRRILLLASLGFAFGLPVGLRSPEAAMYAALAYASTMSAFVIGYAERSRHAKEAVLLRTLVAAAPVLVIYGIAQYFLPLLRWDAEWVKSVRYAGLSSIRAPEEGHLRIFSALNSPGSFAVVLAIIVPFLIATRRLTVPRFVLLATVLVCFALTYVRSAWVAAVVAVVVYAVAARRQALFRIAVLALIGITMTVVLNHRSGTAVAFTQRASSLTSVNRDESAQKRLAFTWKTLPASVAAPLGHGIGQAGLAATLGSSSSGDSSTGIVYADNGYVALMYQVGPGGFALIAVALVMLLTGAWRARRGPPAERREALVLFSLLLVFPVLLVFSDATYGISGMILWYLGGRATALTEGLPLHGAPASSRLRNAVVDPGGARA